jgi:ABC-type multidrug transport system ATPase subunit
LKKMPFTSSPDHTVLHAQAMRFAWPGQPPLFESLTLALGPGVHLLHGEDGCGKSTALTLLAGARAAQGGTMTVAGASFHENPAAYQQAVFWIDPQSEAFDQVNAKEAWATLATRHPSFDTALLAELADAFGLTAHADKPLYMLSTGSKRKVWLSAAFAAGAPLTLIDQPFAALDVPSIRLLRELLAQASEHPGRAWLLADHAAPAGIAFGTVIDLTGR